MKTKVTIFGGRQSKVGLYTFLYDGQNVNTCIIDILKYYGAIFKYNRNFKLCKKSLNQQASKAMFALLSKCNSSDLSIDWCAFHLFDKIVLPIFTYGCQVWGNGNNSLIENVHMTFCKYIVGVRKSTPNCIVYGELGRYPL